jgi:hypothetical protein
LNKAKCELPLPLFLMHPPPPHENPSYSWHKGNNYYDGIVPYQNIM